MSRVRPGDLHAALEPMWAMRDDRAQIERLRRVLLARPATSRLTDDAVELLRGHPQGLSGTEIARRLQRDKGRLLAAIRYDPRFVKMGTGRGTRFRLVARDVWTPRRPHTTGRERPGGDAAANPTDDPSEAENARDGLTEERPA
jgi:hypothetical protein